MIFLLDQAARCRSLKWWGFVAKQHSLLFLLQGWFLSTCLCGQLNWQGHQNYRAKTMCWWPQRIHRLLQIESCDPSWAAWWSMKWFSRIPVCCHMSWMQCLLIKFRYTACLNLVVSSSESDLSLEIFLSTICPRAARLAWDLAGRKCRLSALCVPVRGWHSRRYGEWKMILSQLSLVSSAMKSCQQFCSWLCLSILR